MAKITAYTENTALVGTDLLVVVDDPGGTPLTQKVTATNLHAFLTSKGSDIGSAGTLTLPGDSELYHVTGTTTITDIDFSNTWNGRWARLIFDGILTLTHNGTTLILPGAADIITGPGDSCTVVVDSGDNVKVVQFERALGQENVQPFNASIASQNSITAATLTYITDSNIAIPPSGLRVRSILRWKLSMSKTGAGTAASVFHMRLGTAGTTADTAILTFTLPVVGTANADQFEVFIDVVIRGPLGASCIACGTLSITKNAGTVLGVVNIPTVAVNVISGTFTSTTANLIAGISVTSGASVVFSVQQVIAESLNL